MSGSRKKVLFLVHRVPYPPNRGDRIRSYHWLQRLAQESRVTLATLADEPLEQGAAEELQRLCDDVFLESVNSLRWLRAGSALLRGRSATEGLFYSSALWRRLHRLTSQTHFDRVIAFCSSMVPYLSLPGLRDVPALVDLVDVDSQKFADYATQTSGLKGSLYRLEASRLRKLESALPQRVQAITLVSDAEARLYRSFCPNPRTFTVKNGVNLSYYQPRSLPVKDFHCVFVGALDYPPNADGVCSFVSEVWPLVRKKYPRASFAVVGRNPTPAVRALATQPGVELVGTVPDVRPYLAQAVAVVAPLRIARGVQNKVLEAMAMGKVVVASPGAAEGIEATVGEHLLVARDPAEWVAAIGKLFIEIKARDKISQAALAFVTREHDWSLCLDPLARFVKVDLTVNGSTGRKA
jgi:sugar transferase (PEP-CTERM/EpsH1 system associated)